MQLMYPWFSIGLLAVAIPILIHLLRLRRAQRLIFTNTAFIKEMALVNTRRRKVHDLLLLLLRVTAIAALVLAFCQPFVPALQRSTGGGTGKRIVVDNTFSMQARGASLGSLFSEAVTDAKALGRTANGAGKVAFLNESTAWLPVDVYQRKLDELKLSARRVPSVASRVENGVREVQNPVYILSDFQKVTLGPKWIEKISRKSDIVLVPVVGRATGNLYVDSIWWNDAFVRVKTNVTMHVRLRNGGNAAINDCPVKVFLGNKQVSAFRVSVEPSKAATTVVQVQVADTALAQGRVVTEDAPVTFDNTHYFVLQPSAPIRIVELGRVPVAQQLYSNEPLFTYSFVNPQRVDYGALRRANMVLLHEVATIDVGLRAGLQAVVARGGSVVVVPSALAAAHEDYQRLFKELGLGAVQWEADVAKPELREVAMPNPQEPFFRDVFGAQQRVPTMPRAAPVLRWARTDTDVLQFRDGESFLAGFNGGKGHVYVFSAPFSREYSDFTTHSLFVPVMYRLAMLSFRSEQLPAYRLSQGAVTLQLPDLVNTTARAAAQNAEAGLRLVHDSVTIIPAQRMVGQQVRLEMPAVMETPGFYQVRRGGKVLTTLAFNQDKLESELAAYSADELRAMIGPNRPNIRVVESGAAGGGLAATEAEQTSQPLWRYCLALALLFLLAEALLTRFGSRQRGVGASVGA